MPDTNYEYMFVKIPANFSEANEVCRENKATLVSYESLEEQQWIQLEASEQ